MKQIKKTDGIAIRKRPFSNTSEIITFYTRDYGKISAIAKGIQRKKNPFEGYIELLSLNEILFIDGEGKHLSTLTESTQIANYPDLRSDTERIYAAFFLAEFCDRMVEENDPDRELFALFSKSLVDLNSNTDILMCIAGFAAKALQLLGFMPDVRNCSDCSAVFAGSEKVAVSPTGEGLLCGKCADGTEDESVLLSASSRASLNAILDRSPAMLRRLHLSKSNFSEIWRLLKTVISGCIDKELRTFKYVEKI